MVGWLFKIYSCLGMCVCLGLLGGIVIVCFVWGGWFVLIGLICWCVGVGVLVGLGFVCLMVVSVDRSGSFLCYGDVLYKIIGAGYERVSNQ